MEMGDFFSKWTGQDIGRRNATKVKSQKPHEYYYYHGDIYGLSGFRTMPAGKILAEISVNRPQSSYPQSMLNNVRQMDMKPFKNRQDYNDENVIIKGHLTCMQHFPILRSNHFPRSLKIFGVPTKDVDKENSTIH